MENKNPKIDKWERLTKRFGLLWGIATIALIVVALVANQIVTTTHATQSWAIAASIILGAVSATGIFGLVFSSVALFIVKRRARKEVSENAAPARWHIRKVTLFTGIILLLAVIGFYTFNYFVPKNCNYADCLVFAANDGKAANFQSTDKAGIEWSYQIKRDFFGNHTFVKTALRVDDTEPQFIKELLQGKSLTCTYEVGAFDKRLVTSLFYGIGDNCSGELKENLGQLLFLLQ